MADLLSTSAEYSVCFTGFDIQKLPCDFQSAAKIFTKPGGSAEKKLGKIKEVYIKSFNGNAVHQSWFNADDKEYIISAKIVGARFTKTCHIYQDGTGTSAKDDSRR